MKLDDLETDVYSQVDSDEDSKVGDLGIVKYVFFVVVKRKVRGFFFESS